MKPSRVFIVHAHHEPSSFNGAMTRHAQTRFPVWKHQQAVREIDRNFVS